MATLRTGQAAVFATLAAASEFVVAATIAQISRNISVVVVGGSVVCG